MKKEIKTEREQGWRTGMGEIADQTGRSTEESLSDLEGKQ
jgi:hypothetical protein